MDPTLNDDFDSMKPTEDEAGGGDDAMSMNEVVRDDTTSVANDGVTNNAMPINGGLTGSVAQRNRGMPMMRGALTGRRLPVSRGAQMEFGDDNTMAAGAMNGSVINDNNVMNGGMVNNGDAVPMGQNVTPIGNMNMLADPGASDVMSGSSQPRSNKKWWIAGIIALIVAIVCGVLAVVFLGGGGNRGGGNSVSKESRALFYRFANYTISGEDSEGAIEDEYSAETDYYFVTHQKTQAEQKELFNNVEALLNSFADGFNGSENVSLNEAIMRERELFAFMQIAYTKKVITLSDMQELLIKQGDDATKRYMDEYYGISKGQSNAYMKDLKNYSTDLIESEAKLIAFYSAAGCVKDMYLDSVCMSNNMDNNKKVEIDAVEDELDRNELRYYDLFRLENAFVRNVFTINDLMNGKEIQSFEEVDDSSLEEEL